MTDCGGLKGTRPTLTKFRRCDHLASRKSRKNVFFGGGGGGGDAVAEAGAARARSSAGGGVKPLVSSPSEGRDAYDCGVVSPALGGGSSPPLRPHAARPSAAIMAAAKVSRLHRSTDFFTCTPPPQLSPNCAPCKRANCRRGFANQPHHIRSAGRRERCLH
jgi:hypothetical protein